MAQKITLRTLKSFAAKNDGKIYTKTLSDFNSMTDCVEQVKDEFEPTSFGDNGMLERTLGLLKVWVVSSNYITPYDDGEFKGYRVYNSCGSFIIAIKKEQFKGMPAPKDGKLTIYELNEQDAYSRIVKADRSYYRLSCSTGEFRRISISRERVALIKENLKNNRVGEDVVSVEEFPEYFATYLEC